MSSICMYVCIQAALAMSMDSADAPPPEPCGPGLPLDFKGNYELFAVVTHKGKSAGCSTQCFARKHWLMDVHLSLSQEGQQMVVITWAG